MISKLRHRSICRALLAALFCLLTCDLDSARAQVSTRTSYYPNQNAGALLQEALVAVEGLSDDSEELPGALAAAGKAALEIGRVDIAQLTFTKCLDLISSAGASLASSTRKAICVDYARAFGLPGEEHLLAQTPSLSDQGTMLSLWAEHYVEEGKMEDARRVLARWQEPTLRGVAGAPDLGRLAGVYSALGEPARAEELIQELRSAASNTDSYAVIEATGLFVERQLELGELARAEELLKSSPGDSSTPLSWRVDQTRLLLVSAFLKDESVEAALRVARDLKTPQFQAEGLGKVALRMEPGKDRETLEEQALSAAVEGGASGLARFAREYHRAGLEMDAGRLFARAVESFKSEGPLIRSGASLTLAKCLVETGRMDEASALAGLEGANRSPILGEIAAEQFAQESFTSGTALDDIEVTVKSMDLRIALEAVTRRLRAENLEGRQRSRIAAELARTARRITDPTELSLALSGLVASGLAQPENASLLHPWPLPPTLSGEWTDPASRDLERWATVVRAHFRQRDLPLAAPRAWRELTLRCYEEGRLVEVDVFAGGTPRLLLLLCVGEDTVVLEGNVSPFNTLHETHSPLLETDEQILEFASLFAGSFANAQGRFRVLTGAEVPAGLLRETESATRIGVPAPAILERMESSTRVSLPLLFASALRLAQFEVFADGAVRMVSDETLIEELQLDREVFAANSSTFARMRPELAPYFQRLGRNESDEEASIAIAKLYASGLGRGAFAIDDDAAMRWLSGLSEEKRREAAFQIGTSFAVGGADASDVEWALLWFARATGWGHEQAPYEMGSWLVNSNSPLRRRGGLLALQKGAQAGDKRSLSLLGRAQIYGYYGAEVDTESGLDLLQRAAAKGSADSSYLLGLFYAHGTHVERNPELAISHFSEAETAHPMTGYLLGILRANGFGEQLEVSSIEIYERAARNEVLEADVVLALRCRSGLGMEAPDPARALLWSRRAYEKGHRYGALIYALLLAEKGDDSLEEARRIREEARTLPVPKPTLLTFVDPVYLDDEGPGFALRAEEALRAWSERIEEELDGQLER